MCIFWMVEYSTLLFFVSIFILSYVMMHKIEFSFALFNIVMLVNCEIQILEGGIFHSFICVGILLV